MRSTSSVVGLRPSDSMSTTWPPIMPGGNAPPTPVPMASENSRTMSTTVADEAGSCAMVWNASVCGEDGDGLSVRDVAGRLAAPEIVVIERGEIVVDQRVSVHHLDGGAEVRSSRRQFMRDAASGFHAEDGAQAFAARKGGVPHGAVNGMRFNSRGRQQTLQCVVSERGASFQERKNIGGHASGLIVRERSRRPPSTRSARR